MILNSKSADQFQINGFERQYRIMMVVMMLMVTVTVMVMVYKDSMNFFALKRLEAAGDDRSGRFGLANLRP